MTGIHVTEDVCFPVAHRQVVFTIPKRLRVHSRFDRKLLGRLSSCAWTCIKAEVQRMLERKDVVPGMIAAIQTFGQLLHWNPHIHSLVTCGAYTPEGVFIEKILKHCRLWKASPPRGPPGPFDMDQNLDSEFMNQTPELTFVARDTFLSTF